MNKKIYEESCQLYIEQEIEEGLRQGKSAYSIGKEISVWVEKLFGRKVNSEAIKKRVLRREDSSGHCPGPPPTPKTPLEIPDNQVPEVKHGGKREGAGSPLKYEKLPDLPKPKPFTNAIHIAIFVISHLERIAFDDPKRGEALQKVADWIEHNL